MDIRLTVETGGYLVISSGTMMTIENQPIVMTAEIAEVTGCSHKDFMILFAIK